MNHFYCLEKLGEKRILTLCVSVLLFASLLQGEVQAKFGRKFVILSNQKVVLRIDKTNNSLSFLGFRGDSNSLIASCHSSVWVKNDRRRTYSDIGPGAKYRLEDTNSGKKIVSIQARSDFIITREISLTDDSPEVSISYAVEFKKQLGVADFRTNFNFPDKHNVLRWKDGNIKSQNMGTFWNDKGLDMQKQAWFAAVNPKTSSGLLVMRDYYIPSYAPSFRIMAYKRGDAFSVTYRQQLNVGGGFRAGYSYRLIPFRKSKPEQIVKKAQHRNNLPSSRYSLFKETKVAPVKKRFDAPKMDGVLEACFWGSEPVVPSLKLFSWSRKALLNDPGDKTQMYMRYDDENLYLGIRCWESKTGNMQMTQKTGSNTVYKDDSIEMFFILPGDEKFMQFVFNPKAAKQDSVGKLNDWQVATRINKDNWTAEVVIPFAVFGKKPIRGEVWKANFCRTQNSNMQQSTWALLSGVDGFDQPKKFNEIVFDPILAPAVTRIWECERKNETLVITEIKNYTDAKQVYPMIANVMLPNGDIRTITQDINMNGGNERSYALSFPVDTAKDYNLSMEIVDPNVDDRLYATKVEKIGYNGLVSRLSPMNWKQTRYYARGSMQPIRFVLANYSDKRQKYSFVIEVPKEMEMVARQRKRLSRSRQFSLDDFQCDDIEVDGKSYRRYTLSPKPYMPIRRLEQQKDIDELILPFNIGNIPYDSFTICFYMKSKDGELIEKKNEIKAIALPAFKAKKPKVIETAVYSRFISNLAYAIPLDEVEATTKAMAETWSNAGINLVIRTDHAGNVAIDERMTKAMKQAGIERVRSNFYWHWHNKGYLKNHPNDAAVLFNGKKAEATLCPLVIINNDNAFADIRNRIKKRLQYTSPDGLMRNLEAPKCFSICFCRRCLAEFRKREKIPKSQTLTGALLKTKYRDQWVTFCCWQQAKIEAMVREVVKSFNPNAKLAPYSGIFDEVRNRVRWEFMVQHASIDMAGPSWYETSAGMLGNWEATTKNFKKRVGNTPINAWLASYYLQSDHRVLRSQTLKVIADGFQGYSLFVGLGLEGEHLHDLAMTNTVIADFEDFFLKGKRKKKIVKSAQSEKGFSFAPWELNGERVIFIFSHEPRKTRSISLTNLGLSANYKGWDYMEKEPLANINKINLILKPMEIKVLYFGTEDKLTSRKSNWGADYKWID